VSLDLQNAALRDAELWVEQEIQANQDAGIVETLITPHSTARLCESCGKIVPGLTWPAKCTNCGLPLRNIPAKCDVSELVSEVEDEEEVGPEGQGGADLNESQPASAVGLMVISVGLVLWSFHGCSVDTMSEGQMIFGLFLFLVGMGCFVQGAQQFFKCARTYRLAGNRQDHDDMMGPQVAAKGSEESDAG